MMTKKIVKVVVYLEGGQALEADVAGQVTVADDLDWVDLDFFRGPEHDLVHERASLQIPSVMLA